jgi:hypothetical protein
MNQVEELEVTAQGLSKRLQDQLSNLAHEFNEKVRIEGQKYGLNLITEVNIIIDPSKNTGE